MYNLLNYYGYTIWQYMSVMQCKLNVSSHWCVYYSTFHSAFHSIPRSSFYILPVGNPGLVCIQTSIFTIMSSKVTYNEGTGVLKLTCKYNVSIVILYICCKTALMYTVIGLYMTCGQECSRNTCSSAATVGIP